MNLSRAQITELANALLDSDDELDTAIVSLGMAEIPPSPNRDGLYGYDFDAKYLGTVRYYLRKWCRVYKDQNSGEWRRAAKRSEAATA